MCHGRPSGRPSRRRHERSRWHGPYDAHPDGHFASDRGEEAGFKEDGSKINQGDTGQPASGVAETGAGVGDADGWNPDEDGVKFDHPNLREQDDAEEDDGGQTHRNHQAHGDGPDDCGANLSQADPCGARADRNGAHVGIGWQDSAFGGRLDSKDKQAERQAWQGRHVNQPPL